MSFRKISMILACLGAAGAFYGCDSDVNDMISGCQPGVYKCSGNTLQVCYGLNWQSIDCPMGCDDSKGVCKIPDGSECVIDTCKDKTTVNKCIDGKVSELACAAGQECITGFGCSEGSSPVTECTAGQKRCNGQTLQACSDNEWKAEEFCDQGCDEAALVCKTVQPGELCAGNTCKDEHTRLVCAEDKMSISEELCAEDEECSNGECIKKDDIDPTKCTPDEVKCSVGNFGTISCNENGTWDEEELCPEGEKCDIKQNKCVPEGEAIICEEGDHLCVAAPGADVATAYFECVDGQWGEDFVNCPTDQMCDPGKEKCVDLVVTECQEGDIQCTDDEYYQTCDAATGSWMSNNVACGDGLFCDMMQNKCVPKADAECQEGELKCADDASYYECADGKWSTKATECGEGKYCNKENNKCENSCEDNTYKCSEDMAELLKCDKGVWTTSEKCEKEQLCLANKCEKVDCTPGVDYCTGNGKSAGIYKCTEAGKRGDLVSSCDGQACLDEKTCLVCKDGDVNCTDKGVFQICEKNAWVDIVDCGEKNCSTHVNNNPMSYNGCTCDLGGSIMHPRPDAKCSEDTKTLLTCTSTERSGVTYRYWDELSCGEGKCEKVSQGGQTTYACSCKDKDVSCMDNSLYVCNGGHLVLKESCSENETCDAEKQACLCTDKTYQCVSRSEWGQTIISRQVCDGGKWKNSECGKSYTCVGDDGLCAFTDYICKNDETTCSGNSIVKCVDGEFVESQKCESDEYCRVGITGVSCRKLNQPCQGNQKRCAGDTILTCDKGSWKQEPCGDKKTCVETITGGGANQKITYECKDKVCDNFTYSCDKDVIQICMNNALQNYGDCGEIGMACKDGVCVSK